MNIDEMPAGREMDALIGIAIKATPKIKWYAKNQDETYYMFFDYKKEADEWHQMMNTKYPKHPYSSEGGHIVKAEVYKGYSTGIAAAWEVVEKMHSKNFYLRYFYDGRYGCYFTEPPRKVAYGETAPLAICRAALKAVGVSL